MAWLLQVNEWVDSWEPPVSNSRAGCGSGSAPHRPLDAIQRVFDDIRALRDAAEIEKWDLSSSSDLCGGSDGVDKCYQMFQYGDREW